MEKMQIREKDLGGGIGMKENGWTRVQYWITPGKSPNKSRKEKIIKAALERLGHTNVFVWWESLGPRIEMCGPTGGYMFCSDKTDLVALGYSFDAVMELVNSTAWLKQEVGE